MHGCWDPPATLVHLQISLNEKACETSHASYGNIPNPQILVHQADNWAGVRWREAGDRRGMDLHFISFHLVFILFSTWECLTESV